MRSPVAKAKAQPKKPRMVPAQDGSSEAALALIFAPLERGDGFRHGALGAPGWGKTTHMREVVAAALERQLVDLVLTHDVKGAIAEFEGTEFAGVVKFEATDELEETRHAVFRNDPMLDEETQVEEVATVGKQLARGGFRILLNIGELANACSESGRAWRAPAARWFSAQGRQLRASLAWTEQEPKRAPDEIYNQSTTLAFFHLDERAANYLRDTLYFDPAMVAAMPALAWGEFVLRVQGAPWDGKIYRLRSDR